jgi:hypothetical protein
VITNAGYDFICDVMANNSVQPAVAKYMAVTANATAPAASDTTLTAEITTASGGLIRGLCNAYAHTTGTKVFSFVKTFTANGSDALPVSLNKFGVFNAASAGTMPVETLITVATLSAVGDAVTITDTVTLT